MSFRTNIGKLLYKVQRQHARAETNSVAHALNQLGQIKALSDEVLEKRIRQSVESARNRVMSQAECDMQVVNFVWGNALEGNQGTRDSVKANISRVVAS